MSEVGGRLIRSVIQISAWLAGKLQNQGAGDQLPEYFKGDVILTDQDSIVFKIERETPIALGSLTAGMLAFGAEYEQYFRSEHPKAEDHEAELLVQRITEKCIWIELIGAMTPILQGMGSIQTFVGFVDMVADKMKTLSKPGGRLTDTTPRELDNFARMAETIIGDAKGEAEIIALEQETESGDKVVRTRVIYKAKDAVIIARNAHEQKREITAEDPNRQNGVLMRMFQTNIGNAAPDRASGEKGIIEAIHSKPLRLIYASDMAGQKIKSAWGDDGQSPYDLAFVVDVDVQMVNGNPRAYRIMDVHDIFPIDED